MTCNSRPLTHVQYRMIVIEDPAKVMIALGAFASAWGIVHAIASSVIRFAEIRAGGRVKPEISTAADARLERIEHAMDAIAIEVERISEAQRFTTKLLAERAGQPERGERLTS